MMFTLLNYRCAVSITGKDAESFLQRLITNDIRKATLTKAIYTLLLTPQGKFLYDAFIIKTDDGYLADIDKNHAEACIATLNKYKLRADVTLTITNDHCAVTLDEHISSKNIKNAIFYQDPRHERMGYRAFIKSTSDITLDTHLDEYHRHRIELEIPCGSLDLVSGELFPHDVNMDMLHAIDYKKGCYVGQEVTARMHYKGSPKRTIRKIHSPDQTELPPPGTPLLNAQGKIIGEYRFSVGKIGLAVTKID